MAIRTVQNIVCPGCEIKSSLHIGDAPDGEIVPQVCYYCGKLFIFESDSLSVRSLTQSEIMQMREEDKARGGLFQKNHQKLLDRIDYGDMGFDLFLIDPRTVKA